MERTYVRCEEVRLHELNGIPNPGLCALETRPTLVRHYARFASCSQQHRPLDLRDVLVEAYP